MYKITIPLISIFLSVALSLANASESAPVTPALAPATEQSVFVTSSAIDATNNLVESNATTAAPTVTVTVGASKQMWEGTGAALTDAAVNEIERDSSIIQKLYDPTYPGGAHLNMVRLPTSATDLTPGGKFWAWSWDGVNATPPAQQLKALEVLAQIKAVNPSVRVIAANWSAPASMKTNNNLICEPQGFLGLRDCKNTLSDVNAYKKFLVSQVTWLLNHDVPVVAISLGNEPYHSADYPTMLMDGYQQAELAEWVSPRLSALGVRLLATDHNWNNYSDVDWQLGKAASKSYYGVAYHCYNGSPKQMSSVSSKNENKLIQPGARLVTECTGTVDNRKSTIGWDYSTLLKDAIANGSQGLLYWSMATNSDQELNHTGGCTSCRGLIVGQDALPSNGTTTEAYYSPEYVVWGQLGVAAHPGDYVAALSETKNLYSVGFRSASDLGVTGYNDSNAPVTVQFKDSLTGETSAAYTIPAYSAYSYRG